MTRSLKHPGLADPMPAEILSASDHLADLWRDPSRISATMAASLRPDRAQGHGQGGLVERFAEFRKMGHPDRSWVTGDNPRTAATIAREAGVDDFIAEAKPEDKIRFIREEQAEGHLVAIDRRRHQRRPGAPPRPTWVSP